MCIKDESTFGGIGTKLCKEDGLKKKKEKKKKKKGEKKKKKKAISNIQYGVNKSDERTERPNSLGVEF